MMTIVETLVQILLYGTMIIGALLLFDRVWIDAWQGSRRLWRGFSYQQKLRMSAGFQKRKDNESLRKENFYDHMEILLQATLSKTSPQTVARFLMGSILAAFVVLLLVFVATRNVLDSLMPAVITLWVPYVVLQIRKYHLSIQNSYKIGELVDKIVPEYRKHDGSMLLTLKATAEVLPHGSIRRALVRLTNQLTDHVAEDEVKKALHRFTRELGTTWAIQIANDIEHALVDGVNVEYSLALMHKEFKEIEKARKGQNLARMDSLLVAMVPFVYWPGMMLLFYLYVTRNILVYQFDSPSGVYWFLMTLISTFGSFLIGLIFYKPKQDI